MILKFIKFLLNFKNPKARKKIAINLSLSTTAESLQKKEPVQYKNWMDLDPSVHVV